MEGITMDENKNKEVVADEAFMKNLFELDEPEDVISAFKAKGIELSADDVLQMRDVIKAMSEGDELEDVAGGGHWNEVGKAFIEVGKDFISKTKALFSKKW